METKVVSELNLSEELKYPLIGRFIATGKIVMFTSIRSGIVLVGDLYHKPGFSSDDWGSIKDYSEWQILKDITINFKS